MTSELRRETMSSPKTPSRGRPWGEIAVSMAGKAAAMVDYDRGGLASLRRIDLERPDAAAFWRLLAKEDLLGNPSVESKWGLILHGIALMTNTAGGDIQSRSAHQGNMPVGRALFLGGESQRNSAFYSESRLNRLLTARRETLRDLLGRMFRMLASSNARFNWREMAQYILYEGYDEDRADRARRHIAREYYQAERRSSAQSTD